jgi:hypothetical protein
MHRGAGCTCPPSRSAAAGAVTRGGGAGSPRAASPRRHNPAAASPPLSSIEALRPPAKDSEWTKLVRAGQFGRHILRGVEVELERDSPATKKETRLRVGDERNTGCILSPVLNWGDYLFDTRRPAQLRRMASTRCHESRRYASRECVGADAAAARGSGGRSSGRAMIPRISLVICSVPIVVFEEQTPE